MKNSVQLHEKGQSFWLDNIDRHALIDGKLEDMIQNGTYWGVTSNPSIFQKAITTSTIYQGRIQAMSWAGLSAKGIYENLVLKDIRDMADLLLPVYHKTERKDGYVSIEVDPDLAEKGEETINEAERLWKLVDRPNVMIKIPATDAGIFAIRETIAKGINVNITLIFSLARYKHVIDAYFTGLEDRLATGKDISSIHSVASFFVSRIDNKVDKLLEETIARQPDRLSEVNRIKGKIAIANAINAYGEFLASVRSDRFNKLVEARGNIQRPLWASTSTKNPGYSDILYVQSLILAHTVNTMPEQTLSAFLDHGKAEVVDFEKELGDAKRDLDTLASLDIKLELITSQLEIEGASAFSNAQKKLLEDIEAQRSVFEKEIIGYTKEFRSTLEDLGNQDFVKRLHDRDVLLWPVNKNEVEEVSMRLDWLDAPRTSLSTVEIATALRKSLVQEGFTHAVVLGMGGSSLAPEVYSELIRSFGLTLPGLDLSILDSTSPQQVLEKRNSIPLDKTIFIVSSKSGTTSEMDAAYRYFREEFAKSGIKKPGDHFIAITDPGTPLEKLGELKEFRQVIQSNPNVGGRYSGLIEFGIFPTVLAGLDGEILLRFAQDIMIVSSDEKIVEVNPGVALGILLAKAYESGRDKLTIIADPNLMAIGAWIEQLLAESSGKNGKGILPVDNEPHKDPGHYNADRIFVYLSTDGRHSKYISSLRENGHTAITFQIPDIYQLGAEFYRWEVATAVACSIIGVNAFDQPNVQLSKTITKEMITEYKEKKIINEGLALVSIDNISLFGEQFDSKGEKDLGRIIIEFLNQGDKNGYIAINAFIARNENNEKRLQELRGKILEITGKATTLGFGPRFLHSTGQLHKGGKNNGLFIIITSDQKEDIPIPGEEMSFGTLLLAQAIGDMRALQQQNRRVLRIHFHGNEFERIDLTKLI